MTNTTQKRTIETTIDINTKTLTISTMHHPAIVIGLDEITETMVNHAALHGLKQKIVDAAALGQGATNSEKYNAMMEVYNRIMGGEWNARGEGGGGTPTGLLFRALCRLYAIKTTEEIRTYLDARTKQEQAALRKNPRIAAIIETIKAESVKIEGIDTDGLLDELEG